MKAILVQKDENRSLLWTEVPDPVMKSDEVLVAIKAVGINRADLMQREGNYPPPPGCPEWMGLEIAGIVEEVGDEAKQHSPWKKGDRVCALLGGGGYAEKVSVRYDMLMPIPANCSMEMAAALPEAFATAYLNLFYEGKIEKGDTLLVTAGASGLASVIIPMAKAFGIRVITSVRKQKQAEAIAPLGADRVVNTSEISLAEALKQEEAAGHPVDVAIDCVGGAQMGECLPYLKKGARWIMIASLGGDLTQVNLRTVFVKNIRIIGSTLRSRDPAVKAQILSELVSKLWDKVASGEVRPTLCKTLPITQAEEGHRWLYESRQVGKVVLTVE